MVKVSGVLAAGTMQRGPSSKPARVASDAPGTRRRAVQRVRSAGARCDNGRGLCERERERARGPEDVAGGRSAQPFAEAAAAPPVGRSLRHAPALALALALALELAHALTLTWRLAPLPLRLPVVPRRPPRRLRTCTPACTCRRRGRDCPPASRLPDPV